MTRVPTIFVAAIIALLAPCHARGEAEDTPIRQFSIATIEKLGQELYQRDSLAAAATDLLFETHPEAISLLHKKSLYVTTGKDVIWEVADGSIAKVQTKAEHVVPSDADKSSN